MAENTAELPGKARGDAMTPPPVSERRLSANGNPSPVRLLANPGSPGGKWEDRRVQVNGHASPIRLAANPSSPAGKQCKWHSHSVSAQCEGTASGSGGAQLAPQTQACVCTSSDADGCLRTDDRMRLAKERREERERGLAAREQAIREKERRAQLQYERTVEERWRRLEEQRQKEELRRAAVEEKRRQRLEEEKERLEALMRRSLERSLQLEQRPKRWVWGREGDCENVPPPLSAASAHPSELAAPSPAVSEFSHVPPSPHRSPYRGSPSRADRRKATSASPAEDGGGGVAAVPGTPKKLHREQRTASPLTGSPRRRPESPATPNRRPASPAASKSLFKGCSLSPRKHNIPKEQDRTQDPQAEGFRNHNIESPNRKPVNTDSPSRKPVNTDSPSHKLVNTDSPSKKPVNIEYPSNKPMNTDSHNMKPVNTDSPSKKPVNTESPSKKTVMTHIPHKGTSWCDTAETNSFKPEPPERKLSNPESPAKKPGCELPSERGAERLPTSPTAKSAVRNTDAEEASRLLGERRRQARLQKEQEERSKMEEALKVQEEALKVQMEAQKEEAEKQKREQECRGREDRQQQQRALQDREQQSHIHGEREEAQREAEHQRQERETVKLQEEQERLQRKKRVEEIMKRTRKPDAEMKREELPQPASAALPGPAEGRHATMPADSLVNKKVDGQKKGQPPGQVKVEMKQQLKEEGTWQEKMEVNGQLKQQGPGQMKVEVKDQGPRQMKMEVNGKLKEQGLRQMRVEVKEQGPGQMKMEVKEKLKEQGPGQMKVEVKEQRPGQMKMAVNGQLKAQGPGQMKVEVKEQLKKDPLKPRTVVSMEIKPNGSQVNTPLINLDPLEMKGGPPASVDEVQPMEVSPVSKEELISIPRFSPVSDAHHSSISNTRALEDLLDLTGQVAYPKHSPSTSLGDCNKNLIEGFSPCSDKQLIQSLSSPADKLNAQ
ncbi:MAP7 domain-containing protein 2a isoform X14 [Brienomyrus brachyistius]|uniref:MAP7 domain-containing protein 2a isoform X14 n=1 Tax=Brienomyrus brachyistius TaxID=42636 RepID=UPI0020B1A95D|nr:MAP7 domain-containing protein 2a isoform X14 [Brienomyrus brachyistius]